MNQTRNYHKMRRGPAVMMLFLAYLLIGSSVGATAQTNPQDDVVYTMPGGPPPPCTSEQLKEFYAAAAGHPTKPPPKVDPSIHPDAVPPLCALPGIPGTQIQSFPRPIRLPNSGSAIVAPTMEIKPEITSTETLSSAAISAPSAANYAYASNDLVCTSCNSQYDGLTAVAGHISAQMPNIPSPSTSEYSNRIHAYLSLQPTAYCPQANANTYFNLSVGLTAGLGTGSTTQMQVFWEYFDANNCLTTFVSNVNGANTGFISATKAPRFLITRTAVSSNSVTLEARIKLGGVWYFLGNHTFNTAPYNSIVVIDAAQEIGASGAVDQISSPYNFINNMNMAYSTNSTQGTWYPWHANVLPSKFSSSTYRQYPFCPWIFLANNYTSVRSVTNLSCQ